MPRRDRPVGSSRLSALTDWRHLDFDKDDVGKDLGDLVLGDRRTRKGCADQYYMLYHDDRGVARVFEMELSDQGWTLLREDADFYQRFQADLAEDLITGASEASEDKGLTWRKDFDLVFTRSG